MKTFSELQRRQQNGFHRKTRSILLFLLAALLTVSFSAALTSCGDASITVGELIAAGRTESILKNYDSFTVTIDAPSAGISYSYYIDSEYIFYTDSETAEFLTEKERCGYYYMSEELPEGYMIRTLNATGEDFDTSSGYNCFMDEEFTNKEEITECRKKDGKLYIKAEMPADATKEYFGEMTELKDGDILVIEYVLDADTNTITESKETFKSTDGSLTEFATLTAQYNSDRPAKLDSLLAGIAQTEDTSVITVILDPDTEKEKTFTMTAPKTCYIEMMLPDGYEKFYSDRACTVEYVSDDTTENITVYSVAE